MNPNDTESADNFRIAGVLGLATAAGLGILALDLALPACASVGLLYAVIVWQVTRLPMPGSGYLAAVVCTGLVIAGLLLHVRPDHVVAALASRASTILVIWSAALLTLRQTGLVAALRRSRQQLARSIAASNAKSSLLAAASHDIRTPMTAILGFADLLAGSEIDDERQSMLDTIRGNGQYLLRLIDDLLDLSKIEAGKVEIQTESVSPGSLVHAVESLMHCQAHEKGISLDVAYDGPIPQSITTDPHRLRQVLVNLVANAIKFTDRGGVQLRVACDNDGTNHWLQFDVTDTGMGIPEAEAERLFEPFARGRDAQVVDESGTGLGLAISKRIVELLGGQISVRSQQGMGSTFRLCLPLRSTEASQCVDLSVEQPASILNAPLSSYAVGVKRLQYRILVADDIPTNRFLVSRFLNEEGAEVTAAQNGAEAIDQIEAAIERGRKFDLVLMDMHMPTLDGFEAVRRLRERGVSTPIVALSASAMQDDRDRCLSVGCTDFVSKPIDRADLITVLERCLATEGIVDLQAAEPAVSGA